MGALHDVRGRKLSERALCLFDGHEPTPNLREIVGGETLAGAAPPAKTSSSASFVRPSKSDPIPVREPSGSV